MSLGRSVEIVLSKKPGAGCDGFHPKVALDLTKETRREVLGEGGAEWRMAAISLHDDVLDSEERHE